MKTSNSMYIKKTETEHTEIKQKQKKSITNLHETILKSEQKHRNKSIKKEHSTTKLNSEIETEKIKEIPCIEFKKDDILAQLKPGDILLKYHEENNDGIKLFDHVDFFIRNFHAFTSLYTKTATSYSKNFVHAAIYVGDGKISEAIAAGIRINTLDDDRTILKPGMTCGYVVIRPLDRNLAKNTSILAESLSAEEEEPSQHAYSIPKGLKGLVRNSKLNKDGIENYLIAAGYAHNSYEIPAGHSKIKEFYCSHFVAWSLQAAESLKVISKINIQLEDYNQIEFPDLTSLDPIEAGKKIRSWAHDVTEEHYDILKEEIKMAFNAKNVTPQRFFGFVLEHPELFETKLVITPPSSE